MERTFETIGLVGKIKPDATAAGTVTSGWIAAADYHRFLAVLVAGDLGASATVDAKLRQATSSGGAGAKDVTGSAITQLTQAGSGSNKEVLISLDPSKLDVNNGFKFFEFSVTVAVATSDLGGVVLGYRPRHGAATQPASVAQVIAV